MTLKKMEVQKKIDSKAKILKIKFKLRRKRTWFKFTWYLKKYVAMLGFYIVEKVRKWNEPYFDGKIKELYKEVRTKESIQFKEKIISLGK